MKIFDKIHYIEDNPLYGIKYDFDKVRRMFKKMLKECHAPDGLYDPSTLPLSDARYFDLLSERSSSKTTQCLLFAMCFNKIYGTTIAYIRQLANQITRSRYKDIFKVINDPVWGYVEWLTDKEYNTIQIEVDKKCYYAHRNEEGIIDKVCPDWFMMLMSVEQSEIYTSTFNTTNTDIVVFDEFTRTPATGQDFLDYMQIIATIRRERRNIIQFWLSNTISPYHQFLREQCTASHLATMKRGQHAIITTELGTRVYVELLAVGIHENEEKTHFKASALEFFGFPNEGLKAIYGGEWEIKGFRHLPRGCNPKLHNTRIHLEFMGHYLEILTFSEKRQAGVFIRPFTRRNNPKFTLITDTPQYNPEQYNGRYKSVIRKLMDIDVKGLLYFSDNETALIYHAIVENINKIHV